MTPSTVCPACSFEEAQDCRAYQADSTALFEGRRIVRCRRCGLGFADPMPRPDELLDYYRSNTYEGSFNFQRASTSPWSLGVARAEAQAKFVVDHADRLGSWLDVGAGYGFLLDEARRRGATLTVGVEATPDRLTDLRARGHRTATEIDEVTDRFDVISISHFLEHVPDPVDYLAAMKGRLEPGGLLFCEVPNEIRLERPKSDTPHVVFFDPDTLADTMRRAGLALVASATCGKRIDGSHSRLRRQVNRAGLRWAPWTPPVVVRHLHLAHTYGPGRIWLRAVARA